MTPEEIKAEILNVKIPWFVKLGDKYWHYFGRFAIMIGTASILPLGIIYNNGNSDYLWNVMIGIFLFLIFGIGGLMLLSNIIEDNFVKKEAKKLGISVYQWNIYAGEINLMSFKK